MFCYEDLKKKDPTKPAVHFRNSPTIEMCSSTYSLHQTIRKKAEINDLVTNPKDLEEQKQAKHNKK